MGASISSRSAVLKEVESNNGTITTLDLRGEKLSESECRRLGSALLRNT